MSRSAFIPVAVLCCSLTFAAVAQTQTGNNRGPAVSTGPTPTDLIRTVELLEHRVASLERRLEDRQENLDRSLVRFGDVTGNLQSERLNRYLRASIVLGVAPSQKMNTAEAISGLSPRLKDWLVSHIADMTLADVTGKARQDLLRDEIRTGLNSVLKTEGYPELIEAVLFDEFNIQ